MRRSIQMFGKSILKKTSLQFIFMTNTFHYGWWYIKSLVGDEFLAVYTTRRERTMELKKSSLRFIFMSKWIFTMIDRRILRLWSLWIPHLWSSMNFLQQYWNSEHIIIQKNFISSFSWQIDIALWFDITERCFNEFLTAILNDRAYNYIENIY